MSARLKRIARTFGKGLGAAVMVMLLLLVMGSDALLFERPARQMERAAARTRTRLTKRKQVHFLAAFDAAPPVEWVSGKRLLQAGVKAVPGPFHPARRFSGDHRAFIASERNWADLGDRFTISMWLMLEDAPAPQTILYTHRNNGIGLTLNEGRLVFHVPGVADQQVSYPFTAHGRFVHIAAVTDASAGQAALYENGRKMAGAPIERAALPEHGIGLSQQRWYSGRSPLHGAVGETIIWSRALPEKEIRRLAQRRRSSLPSLGGLPYARLRFFERLRQGIRASLKTADAFHVRLHAGQERTAIPELRLYVSNKARTRLSQGHKQSLRTGIRTDQAARSEKAALTFAGNNYKGTLRLEASADAYGTDTPRMALAVSMEEPVAENGIRHLRLVPPEARDFLLPLLTTEIAARSGLPHVANGLCRVTLNGERLGVYYFEDGERAGVFPGQWAAVFSGATHPGDWRSLFTPPPPADTALSPLGNHSPFDEPSLHRMLEEIENRYAEYLLRDDRSPMSRREIRYRLRKMRASLPLHFAFPAPDMSEARRAADRLTEFMLLGDNPSPLFIVNNLSLNAFHAPDVRIAWKSAHPDVIGHDGAVHRPDGALPVEVAITATLTDHEQAIDKTLRFRVQPRTLTLPAVMLYARDRLFKTRRVEALVDYHPAGSDGRHPQRFYATQSRGGGIAHRGNTAHWRDKKPFNLKVNAPHFLFDDTPTRHIHFTTAVNDQTFIRNALAYDVFRSFGEPGAVRQAPVIQWAEVFVNGTYYGLYELTRRIDRHMLDLPSYREGTPYPGEIFKQMDQKYPPLRSTNALSHYRHVRDALKHLPPDAHFQTRTEQFDMANVIDFHLLLNLLEGVDNQKANYFIARDPGPDAKYCFVAWDHKRGFRGGTRTYIHHFFSTVYQAPAFQARMRERWSALRADRLTDAAVLNAIDAMAAHLSGYTRWEYERWGLNRGQTFDEQVAALKRKVSHRLAFLDTRYGCGAHAPQTQAPNP